MARFRIMNTAVEIRRSPQLPITLTSHQLRTENGTTFFLLNKRDQLIRRLLASDLDIGWSERYTVLCQTDIAEQLVELKNKAVREACMAAAPKGAKVWKKFWKNPTMRQAFCAINSRLTIRAPDVGNIEGIPMTVLSRKRDGLWLELNEANLDYLTKVVAEQFKSGVITRNRNKRQRSEIEPDQEVNEEHSDGDDDASEYDGEDYVADGGVDSGEVRATKPNILAMLGAKVAK